MAAAGSQVPVSLKQIGPYIRIASEHENKNPVIAYWCRFYALEQGLKINKTGEARNYLMSLMDCLEKMKQQYHDDEAFTNDLVAQSHVENHALKLFNWADQQDRSSNFDKSVIRAFHASGYIFDILVNFGELSEESARMSRYAKWKAAYIHRCLKEGKQPVPGPMKGDDEGFEEDGAGPLIPGAQEPGAFGGVPTPAPRGNVGGGGSFDMGLPDVPQAPEETPYSPPAAPFVRPQDPYVPPSVPQYAQQPLYPKDESTGAYPKVPQPQAPYVAPVGLAFVPPPTGGPLPTLTTEQMLKAQKYTKYATSALTYEDVPTALMNLHKALALLTTGVDPQ